MLDACTISENLTLVVDSGFSIFDGIVKMSLELINYLFSVSSKLLMCVRDSCLGCPSSQWGSTNDWVH